MWKWSFSLITTELRGRTNLPAKERHDKERHGVQIFIATHSYVLLKEFELQRSDQSLRFFALYKDDNDATQVKPAESYNGLAPNKIADGFSRIYDLEVERALGGK